MRFYIDIHDDTTTATDNIGSNHRSFDAARLEAVQAMYDIARDKLPKGEEQEHGVTIRDDSGTELYRAELTFKGQQLDVRGQAAVPS